MAIAVPSVPKLALPLDLNGTLTNLGPGSLYYRDESPVDASTKDGTLASGSSVAVAGTVWLVADSSGCSVSAIPSATASSGGTSTVSATVVNLGGNLGSTETIATAGDNIVARNAILDQASCTVTLTGLPASEYRFVKIIGVKGASGDETLLIDDGSGAVEVSTPTGAGAAFEINVDWDGSDSSASLAGGGGGGDTHPFPISYTTGLQTALDSKPTATLDTDGTLAANSDAKVASQKAVKTYVTANAGGTAPLSPASVYGLKAWNWDPINNNSTIQLGDQTLMTTLIVLPVDATISNLVSLVTGAGSGLTYAAGALWTTGGTLIARTNSRITAWQAAFYTKDVAPLTAESGQSLALTAGTYIAGLLPVGTVGPTWSCVDGTKEILNMGHSDPAFRSAIKWPVSNLTGTLTVTSNNKTPWMGLS